MRQYFLRSVQTYGYQKVARSRAVVPVTRPVRSGLALPHVVSNGVDQLNQLLVMFAGLGGKMWDLNTQIIAGECGTGINFPCEEAFTQRTKGYQTDAECFEQGQDLSFRLSGPQRVFTLQGDDWLDRMGTADRVGSGLREAKPTYLSLRDQILDHSGNIFHRDRGVNTVLIIEIDVIRTQSLEAAFNRTTDLARCAVNSA